MTATNHTEHYGLSQYTEDDHPTYTGDYNGDMSKIDAAIHAASQSGGMTAVAHDDTLTGNGTDGSPLAIADGNTFSKPIRTVSNLNDAKMPGLYELTASSQNGPHSSNGNRGEVIVVKNPGSAIIGQIAIQNYKTSGKGGAPGLYFRSSQDSGNNWSDWGRLAFISEVDALSSRITTLEQQVSALTAPAAPSSTGLTATQLDAQYSDNYNIVQVGPPTRNIESEETSHE